MLWKVDRIVFEGGTMQYQGKNLTNQKTWRNILKLKKS